MLKISFETDGAAFEGGYRNEEIAFILQNLAKTIADGYTNGIVRDYNGNGIGHWSITETVRDSD